MLSVALSPFSSKQRSSADGRARETLHISDARFAAALELQRTGNSSRCGTAPRSGRRPYTKSETASHSKFRRRSRLPRFNRHCQIGLVYANWNVPPNSIAILIFFSISSALSHRLSSSLEKQMWAIGRFVSSKTLTQISG
jgi:hypothetical protein